MQRRWDKGDLLGALAGPEAAARAGAGRCRPQLLDVVAWLQAHPRPGIYLRQVDLPGIHNKFIEGQRGVLSELLDLALPGEAIAATSSGAAQFARRYGFRDKPLRVRLRFLDPGQPAWVPGADADYTLSQAAFVKLAPAVRRVFITENEINFLAFPPTADSLVVFGAGYGFDALAQAAWLQRCKHALLGRHRHPRIRHPRSIARPLPARAVVPDGP